jgi:hypothetical protein
MMSDLLDLLDDHNEIMAQSDSSEEESSKPQFQKPMWVNASDVAAITGYNKYADILQLTSDYIYKGRDDLLLADETLDVRPMSEAAFLQESLCKTRNPQELEFLVSEVPETHIDLQDLNQKIEQQVEQSTRLLKPHEQEVLAKAVSEKSLTSEDVDILKKVDTSSLAACDKEALSSAISGTIDVQAVESLLNKKTVTDEECTKLVKQLKSNVNRSYGSRKEHVAIRLYEMKTGHRVTNNNDRLYKLKFVNDQYDPYFWVCGKVDGIVHKPGSLDRCLLEVKNRKNRLFHNVPLYDQIQTMIYMKMLGCSFCDFVQCLTTPRGPKIAVNEITVNQQLWAVVQRRLYKFIDMIYKLRDSPELRHRFIQADSSGKYAVLHEMCDWIVSD